MAIQKTVLITIWAVYVIQMIKLLLDGENDSDNLSLNFARFSLFTIMIDYYWLYQE